jgi:hypothetical protein
MKWNEESRHCFLAWSLECSEDAKGILASGPNRVAREQPSKVDEFQRVAYVCDIALKPRGEFFTLEQIGSHRKVLCEVRADAVAIEIEVIDHHLAVFCRILLGS